MTEIFDGAEIKVDESNTGARSETRVDIPMPEYPFMHKEGKTAVKFEHLENMYGIMRKVTQDMNRALRRLNRADDQIIESANQLQLKLAEMCNEINIALEDLGSGRAVGFPVDKSGQRKHKGPVGRINLEPNDSDYEFETDDDTKQEIEGNTEDNPIQNEDNPEKCRP
ncbi:hypothetical protein DdX_19019 [Ditylenchus destructor]|uniref:Uncharacterized protein n=1 Tax=Ditylenchus destructor TaxID=166010 RepID=A0AAD4QUG4_9BILA|nr:hypothetical protein DdX_19019 [Ditylenchus destructor]